MKAKLLLLAVLGAVALGLGPAQAAGKLAGRVVDEAGDPLPGVNVVVEGTGGVGAATDLDGYYVILNLPPGTYDVRFSAVGYVRRTVQGVRVASDQTTTLDAVLPEEVIEGEEVVVTAERPVVDVTLTSQVAILQKEDIDLLPVQSLADLVELQAGVVDGHFRGGRIGEVQYQVEGVTVNNPFNNESLLRLDRSLLQEVQVISGTFDAEYGQALSGVVNAVLRDGDPDAFELNAETYFGDYVSPEGKGEFTNIESLSPLGRQNYQASLSGPTGLFGTTFLLSGQRILDEGYLYGERLFLPTDSVNFETGALQPTGDAAVRPLGFNREWSALARLTNRTLLPRVKLAYQAVFNQYERKNRGAFGGAFAYRLNPDGTKTQEQTSLVHGLDLTHTLTDRLFYEVNLRQNYIDYKDLVYDDLFDPRYLLAGPPRSNDNLEDGAVLVGVDPGRFVQSTNSFVVKGAVTWQATRIHLLKAGIEGQVADLRFGAPGGFLTGLEGGGLIPNDSLPEFRVSDYTPVQGAAYVQDRIEWNDLRVRVGLRAEVFDPNATVPSDPQNPANAIAGAPPSRPVDASVKLVVAPRLGVSFPVSERASLFFSWGHFYQVPGLGQFFANSDYSVLRDLQAGSVSFGVRGNPDLRPEFTAQYEFGFKAALTPFLGLDVAAFYKDIRDLLGVEFISTYAAAEYARLTNVDFGNVRGFTVALDQRRLGAKEGFGVSTTLDYTLQLAQGNSSDPRETATRAEAGEDPRPRVVPFSWDQRHTVNGTVVVNKPRSFSATAVLRFGTGQPYTPDIGLPGFDSSLGANSARKPTTFVTDLRAEKFFSLGGVTLTAFGRVFNLFDTRFDNGFVFSTTGSPFYTLAPVAQRNLLGDPSRFAAPRRVEVGVSFNGALGR